jgi:tetratricopeptide (TPR) repeat protein
MTTRPTVILSLVLVIFAATSRAFDAPIAYATTGAAGPPPASTEAPAPDKPAAETDRRAHRLFEQAEAHFKEGLFAEALGEYQAGYDAVALPGFLINIAQCQRRLGDLTRARATYRQFIMVAPDSPFVPQVRALIVDLDKLLEDLEGSRDSAKNGVTRTGEDGAEPHPDAPRKGLPVLRSDGSPAPATSLLAGPATPPPPTPRKTTRWWWASAIGVAALAAGTATYFALRPGETTTIHDGSLGTLRR